MQPGNNRPQLELVKNGDAPAPDVKKQLALELSLGVDFDIVYMNEEVQLLRVQQSIAGIVMQPSYHIIAQKPLTVPA